MASEWYYAKEGAQQGPVSDEQIEQLIAAGHIQPTDLVWKNGMADWQPLAQIPEFAGVAVAAPPAMPATPPVPSSGAAPVGSLSSSADDIWPILILVGGAILFLSFFMPWWGYTWEAPDKDDLKRLSRAIKTVNKSEDWYDDHGVTEGLEDEREDDNDADEISVWVWGWNSGIGITTFVFSFAVLPLAIVPMFVVPAQKWAWTGSFVCAIFGLVTFILFLVWFFSSPSENVSPILAQGVMLGAYMSFIAALLLLTGGIMDGINGVKTVVKARKAG